MDDPTNSPGTPPESASRSVRCEKHGLRYDPADPRGCVLCRREAGVPVQAAARAHEPPPRDPAGALRNAWLTTAALIIFTALALFFTHDAAVKMFSQVVGGLEGPEEYPEGWPEDGFAGETLGGEGVEVTRDEDGNPVVNRILQIPEDLREIEEENEKKVREYERFQDQ